MSLYLFRVMAFNPPEYELSKWEDPGGKRPVDVYNIKRNYCDCPAHVAFCKHLAKAKELRESGAMRSGLVWDDVKNTVTLFWGSDGEFVKGI